ncbi:hypothetical protein CK203_092972 [Vitis vinifera]|uniref:DUF659 domain-containing protein n=1 Tax=Vitis vinifera TaxID=29760 RepID=A0A438DFM4_VITVI|nr:hypothetical protein CK203_092972 [Vitis vinifera]
MLDVMSAISLGYKGPNYHKLRVNILKNAKKEVQLLVDSYRAIWEKVGCIIMGDGWTDNRQRTLINFLVYCPEGISFVRYIDASNIVKDATNLLLLFDEDLQALVTSKFFVDSRYSRDNKSKVVVSIILDNRFWNDCFIVVNLMSSLMRLLRIVDCDERSSMRYVYEGMYRKNIHLAAYWLNPCFQYDHENFCNKPTVIGVLEETLLILHVKYFNLVNGGDYMDTVHHICKSWFYNKKRIYDPIDYACIDEIDFWIVDEDQPAELDVEELENLLYEEGLIPINEVKDGEDGGGIAIEGLDVDNFGFTDAHFQSPYSNFQNK